LAGEAFFALFPDSGQARRRSDRETEKTKKYLEEISFHG
jgi:hypothetical protein